MHVFKKSFPNLFDNFSNLSPTIGGYVWWWYSMSTPTRDVILPPLRPCMGGNPRPFCGLRLTSHCLPVCCHWLLLPQALVQFQAYDLCHASFLRPLSAISSIAFSFSGFKLLLIVHGCILRVYGGVFVVSIGQV